MKVIKLAIFFATLFSVLFFIFLIWMSYPNWIKSVFEHIPNLYPSAPKSGEAEVVKTFGELFGTFGDSFGALNTLFSGFAFAGIIISIFLQSKELQETREEIKAQKEEFKKQTAVFNKQTFENTFFQMLQQHNELIKSIGCNIEPNQTIYGREAIEEYKNSMERIFLHRKYGGNDLAKAIYPFVVNNRNLYENNMAIMDVYITFHNYDAPQLRIYFMSIYQILKYVRDKEEKNEIENGKFYTNILRAQLLNSELEMLFLNCLSEQLGSDKFKPLVEKYAFFEHLSPKKINTIIAYEDITKYKLEAFGTNEHYTGIHKSYSKK